MDAAGDHMRAGQAGIHTGAAENASGSGIKQFRFSGDALRIVAPQAMHVATV
jgi:hypothetical protein